MVGTGKRHASCEGHASCGGLGKENNIPGCCVAALDGAPGVLHLPLPDGGVPLRDSHLTAQRDRRQADQPDQGAGLQSRALLGHQATVCVWIREYVEPVGQLMMP